MKRTHDPTRGIPCPRCKGRYSSVAETRREEDGIKRTRVCSCGCRFITVEKFEKIPESLSVTTIGSDVPQSSS